MDRVAGTDVVDLVDGTITSPGSKFKIHIPGRGIVALTAGRQVRDASGQIIFSAGPADIDTFNPIALCTGPGVTVVPCQRATVVRGDLRRLPYLAHELGGDGPMMTAVVHWGPVVRGPGVAQRSRVWKAPEPQPRSSHGVERSNPGQTRIGQSRWVCAKVCRGESGVGGWHGPGRG